MKKQLTQIGFILLTLSVGGCSSETDDFTIEGAKDKVVVIGDKVPLRQEPEKEGKWMSALNTGEVMSFLDKAVDGSDKDREYFKVKLSDGTVGWAPSYGIVRDALPGAITAECKVYSRPDLLTETKKAFKVAEIIAVTQEKDGWYEVVGFQKNKKGWIHAVNVSLGKDDIAIAALARKEVFKGNNEIDLTKLPGFLENVPYKNTTLFNILSSMLGDEGGDIIEEEVEEEEPTPDTTAISTE